MGKYCNKYVERLQESALSMNAAIENLVIECNSNRVFEDEVEQAEAAIMKFFKVEQDFNND